MRAWLQVSEIRILIRGSASICGVISALTFGAVAGAQIGPPVDTVVKPAHDSTPGAPADTGTKVIAFHSDALRPFLTSSAHDLLGVNGEVVERLRTEQLRTGVGPDSSLLLRSASSLNSGLPGSRALRLALLKPQFLLVNNTAIPFSQNYGAMWAGRGLSTRTLAGLRAEAGGLRLTFAPEIIVSANSDWVLRHDFYAPAPPVVPSGQGSKGFVLPFYFWTFPIDNPMRFGDRPIRKFDWGQSTAMVTTRRVEAGFSNESEWWGPGIRNAIVLSNNAPGFPHLFLRTASPLRSRLGTIDARWLVGALSESRYFDTVSTNNTRSVAAIGATLQTAWDPNLSFGIARSVYSNARSSSQALWRWLDVFKRTTRSEDTVGPVPPPQTSGKDQILSLFSRWVFPRDGAEVYVEWARTRVEMNLRDFLIAPNYTQGYTIGAQWRSQEWRGGSFRLQVEITQLEQSATFRDRPGPSWYASNRVLQGYTNNGQVIGASIGPGASTQSTGVDFLKPGWRLGAYIGRIRWNEDTHSNFGFPGYAFYCNHDVSVYPGIRAGKLGRLGSITADLTLENRLNAFFQNAGGCPDDRAFDIRNKRLAITFAPFGSF